VTAVSRGKIVKRTWKWDGQKRVAYCFDVAVNGKRTRRQYPTRAEAQAALDQFRAEARSTKAGRPVLSFGEAVTRYVASKARRKALPEVARILEGLKGAFGADTPIHEITAARISAWKAARLQETSRQTGGPLSAAAVNRPLATLRNLLKTAANEWELLEAVPAIRLEQEPKGRVRWLTAEEAYRLLEACRASQNPDLHDLVEFAMFTGVRQGEALSLDWGHVARERGVVVVAESKNGKPREVPLNVRADAVLLRRGPRGSGLVAGLVFGAGSFDHFRTSWETAVRRAKLVAPLRFHDLRHTFASWAVQRGASLHEVKDLLGHSSLQMVLRYGHLAPENLRRAAATLDGVLPNPGPDGAWTAQELVALQEATQKCV
jgi:integrase